MTIVVEVRNYKILLIRQSDCVLVYKQDDYAVSVAKMHMAHSLISAREFELDIGQATCTWKPQQHLLLLLLQHTSRATAHTIGPVPMTTFQFQIVFSLYSTSVWDRISATSLIQQVYNVGGNGQYNELKKGSFFCKEQQFLYWHTLWNSSKTQISKSFFPNIDLWVLWLKDTIVVLLDTIPCPPASEH